MARSEASSHSVADKAVAHSNTNARQRYVEEAKARLATEADEASHLLKQTSSGFGVPIALIILVTTVVSTGVSLAGGLALYFESVSSIDSIQREVAGAVITELRGPLNAVFDEADEALEWSRREFFYANRTDSEMFKWGVTAIPSYVRAHRSIFELRLVQVRGFAMYPTEGLAWGVGGGQELDPVTGEQYIHVLADQGNNVTADHNEALLPPEYGTLSAHPFGQHHHGIRIVVLDTDTLRPKKNYRDAPVYNDFGWPSDARVWQGPIAWQGGDVPSFLMGCVVNMFHPSPGIPSSNYPNVTELTGLGVACITFADWQAKLEATRKKLQEGAHFVVVERTSGTVIANSVKPGPNILGAITGEETFAWTPELLRERTLQIDEVSPDIGEAWDATSGPTPDDDGLDSFKKVHGLLVYRTRLFHSRHPPGIPDMIIDIMWSRPEHFSLEQVNKALVLVLIFVCCVLVSDLFLGVVEVVLISMPLRRLADDMTRASVLALAGLEHRSFAAIREVQDLQHAFAFLHSHLVEYRRLVPAHLFETEHSWDTPTSGKQTREDSMQYQSTGDKESPHASPKDNASASHRTSFSSVISSHDDDGSTTTDGSPARSDARAQSRVMPPRLSGKKSLYSKLLGGRVRQRVSFFYAQWDEGGPVEDFIFQISKVVDETNGDIYLLGEKSVAVAYCVSKRGQQSDSLCVTAAFQLAEVNCWCGITSGTANAGIVRSHTFSTFVIDDAMLHKAKILAQISEVMQLSPLCLKDERVGLATWAKQTVDIIAPQGLADTNVNRKQHVQQLLFASKTETIEWMYAMAQEEAEEEKSTTQVLASLGKYGFKEEQLQMLDGIVEENPSNTAAKYWRNLLVEFKPAKPYSRQVFKYYIERFGGFAETLKACPTLGLPAQPPTLVVTNNQAANPLAGDPSVVLSLPQ